MNKNIAKRWANALRSGKYKKTKESLKKRKGDSEYFCALGVLCDLYQKTHKNELKESAENSFYSRNNGKGGWYTIYIENCEGTLPQKVKTWAGMRSEEGYLWRKRSLPSISEHNDLGKSFKDIADIIEENIENL